ncbi:hypothetical protein D3C71_1527470 [compost metagenome]
MAQRHAHAGLQRGIVIARIARDDPPALHEPLQALVIPVDAGFVERRFFTSDQHAIFIDAQGHDVAAGREARGIDIVDAAVQIERLQQALAIVGIHACVAAQQHGQGRALAHGGLIDIRLGGAEADAFKAIQRQHGEREVAAECAGEVAAVHATELHVVPALQIMAQVSIVDAEVLVTAAPA